MDSKIITVVVVVAGIAALAACARFGVEKDTIAELGAVLVVVAGLLKGAK